MNNRVYDAIMAWDRLCWRADYWTGWLHLYKINPATGRKRFLHRSPTVYCALQLIFELSQVEGADVEADRLRVEVLRSADALERMRTRDIKRCEIELDKKTW